MKDLDESGLLEENMEEGGEKYVIGAKEEEVRVSMAMRSKRTSRREWSSVA